MKKKKVIQKRKYKKRQTRIDKVMGQARDEYKRMLDSVEKMKKSPEIKITPEDVKELVHSFNFAEDYILRMVASILFQEVKNLKDDVTLNSKILASITAAYVLGKNRVMG